MSHQRRFISPPQSPYLYCDSLKKHDIVGTVYHLVIYTQSNKIHNVVLMSKFIQHLCLLYMFRTSPVHHQERFVQAVFADLVCGNTRTTRHVQPLQQLDVSSSTCVSCWTAYILKDDTRSLKYQVKSTCFEIFQCYSGPDHNGLF